MIGAALVLLRWLFAGRVSYSLASYSYGPRFGMIIEVLAGIVQAACALTLFRRSGEELPWRESHTSETCSSGEACRHLHVTPDTAFE